MKGHKHENLHEYLKHQEMIDERLYAIGIAVSVIAVVLFVVGLAFAIPLCIHESNTRKYEYTLNEETYSADYCYTTSSGEFVCESDRGYVHPEGYRRYHEE